MGAVLLRGSTRRCGRSSPGGHGPLMLAALGLLGLAARRDRLLRASPISLKACGRRSSRRWCGARFFGPGASLKRRVCGHNPAPHWGFTTMTVPFRASFPACSRPAICISGNYLGRHGELDPAAGHAMSASIAWSICTRSPSGRIRRNCNRAIRDVTAAYIACGLDPKRSIIFNQSQVAEHAELAWMLQLRGPDGLAQPHDPVQGKGRQGQGSAPRSGSIIYPNLMAADILAYHATHVPVGEDQKQHLELARDIAQKFNIDYAERRSPRRGYQRRLLPVARAADHGPATRVMSLARRHQEDVEIRPVRAVAHQSHRRCRHDRQEDPQGQAPIPSRCRAKPRA